MMNHLGDIKLSSYSVLNPELYLCGLSLFLLMYGVIRARKADLLFILAAVLILAISGWLSLLLFGGKFVVMNGMFVSDTYAVAAKCMILFSSAIVLLLSSAWVREGEGQPFEFIILVLFSTLGMLLMVSANDFISVYMAVELSSLAQYVLASFSRDNTKSSEAGLKYFMLGALASGMMLYGISLVYGFSGSTSFDALRYTFAAAHGVASSASIVGMVLIIVGLCFKVSAVPFHMWTPDVYEGAPTPVTAFFATAPKVAAVILFGRILMQPFAALEGQWQQVIIFASIGSMLVGALAGVVQTNLKRLLAYSSISHVGFMLMGLASGTVTGMQATVLYLAVYIVSSAGAFGCMLLMRRNGHYVEKIKDMSGLGQTNPAMAMIIALFMFSLAGIPPMAGFFGKMFVVQAAIAAGFTWLAVVGVITSVVSCYYYIKIVKIMYFDEPAPALDKNLSLVVKGSVIACGILTLAFFLMPSPLVMYARLAAESLLR